jgi:cell division protein FtsQ
MATTMPRTAKAARRPKRRRFPARAAVTALAGAAALAALAMHPPEVRLETYLPLEYVRVEGDIWNLDADEFRKALLPYLRGGYLAADLKGIEAEARAFAWIDTARVARIWPDTVAIQVEEQKPVALWGQDSLLNDRGERFTPPSVAAYERLPRLSGPDGQEKLTLGTLRALNAKLEPEGMRIAALSLSPRRAWTAQLEGGMEIVFGKQDPMAAMQRLLSLLPRLGEERVAAIQKLDLRYPNGFAVVWKPADEAPVLPAAPLAEPKAAADVGIHPGLEPGITGIIKASNSLNG